MANKVYVSEFRNAMSPIGTYAAPVLPMPPLASQIVAVSGSSTPSNAFTSSTYAILVVTDTACCFAIDVNPTADATKGLFLPANVPMIFAVPPGSKIAVISA